eukprot:8384601-Alexandrium_andersonii.AAC.1
MRSGARRASKASGLWPDPKFNREVPVRLAPGQARRLPAPTARRLKNRKWKAPTTEWPSYS